MTYRDLTGEDAIGGTLQIHREVDTRDLTLDRQEVVVAQAIDCEGRPWLLPCAGKQSEAKQLYCLGDREPLSFGNTDTEPNLHLGDAVLVYDGH